MINVGIAGIGFMGWIHWLAYKKVDGAQVKAIHAHGLGLVGSWRNLCNIMYLGDPFAQKTSKWLPYMEPSDFRDDLPDHRKRWGGTPSW